MGSYVHTRNGKVTGSSHSLGSIVWGALFLIGLSIWGFASHPVLTGCIFGLFVLTAVYAVWANHRDARMKTNERS